MTFLILLTVAYLVGGWTLRRFHWEDTVDKVVFRALAGLAICATLIMALGSVSLRWVQFVMYVAAAGGLAYELLWVSRRGTGHPRRAPSRTPFSPFEKVCVGAITASALLSLSALAPLTNWDACVAHMALPAAYAREGRLGLFEGNAYSAYPHLLHSLNAYLVFESGETSAKLFSWFMGFVGCGAMFCLGRRVLPGAEGRRCGLASAALFATVPIFIDQAGAATPDVPFTGFVIAALAALMTWATTRQARWLALAAFLAGSACGIRHTAYLVCVLLALGVFAASLMRFRERGTRHLLRMTAAFSAIALLAALPWLLRSALLVGNPLYPFLTEYFPEVRGPEASITSLYLSLFFVPMILVGATTACSAPVLRRAVAVLLTLSFAVGLAFDARAIRFKLPAAFGIEEREGYLTRRVERYGAFAFINKNIDPEKVVLTLDPRSYYIKGRSYQNFRAVCAQRDKPLREQLEWLRARQIRYVLVPHAYLAESPGFEQCGLLDCLRTWQSAPRNFRTLRTLSLPRPGGDGEELVSIYEIHYTD